MDIRTNEYTIEIPDGNITAKVCKEEFHAIMSAVGQNLTFIIRDQIGDIYTVCLEQAQALVDMNEKTMTINYNQKSEQTCTE